MRLRAALTAALATATCATALATIHTPATAAPTDPTTLGIAQALNITPEQATTDLVSQRQAHSLYHSLTPLHPHLAGHWFNPTTGNLTLAVTTQKHAEAAREAGADAVIVPRTKAELTRLDTAVRTLIGKGVPGVFGWGTDVQNNQIQITVNTTAATSATQTFLTKARELGPGVSISETTTQQRRQAGTVQPGNPWWPGSESGCSIGFATTDSAGGKHFLTAGHCTNDVNQPAYGQSGQQNRIGTSNVGGTRSVNGREGDMGVVAVTEPGWTLSAAVNTWGQPAVTVTGSVEAMVGDRVCHSGNTSKWQCGVVKYTNRAVDYGGGLVIEGLTWTTACSLGGDSGGAWMLGDKAVGLHEGGPSRCVQNPSDGELSLFQPVNEALRKWNLTLVTGGGGEDDTTAPSTPANPRSTGSTGSSVSLAWDAATDNVGVTGYEVYNGSTLATTVAGTSATVDGLSADTAYTFTVRARDAAGNRSAPSAAVNARTQPGGGGGRTFTNITDYPIQDFRTAVSPVRSTAAGAAARPVTVLVNATHSCYGDLNITLVSPTGRSYALARWPGGNYACTPFPANKTFTVTPAASEPASGTWTLRIGDNGPRDTGVLDSWSVTV
ncbi:proprotein convertase P-domain-containing protein [Actinokineospora guangxiensis]|uniref:Proprotein convertase P-domain-containing protein n=1 Tax=Actinokineospora guangxiensis TaxID=1490288 RepID=A0ABW0ETW2_9PSEU